MDPQKRNLLINYVQRIQSELDTLAAVSRTLPLLIQDFQLLVQMIQQELLTELPEHQPTPPSNNRKAKDKK